MITVNQREWLAWHEGITVRELLDRLAYTFPHVIVSIDGTMVPYNAYAETHVPDNASVRVIHLMAGG